MRLVLSKIKAANSAVTERTAKQYLFKRECIFIMTTYFPILKWKRGEQIALQNIGGTAPQLMPVIQIVDDSTPTDFCDSIRTYYNHPIYLDTSNHPDEDDHLSVLNSYIQYAQANGFAIYPIVNYPDIAYIPSNINRCAVYLPIPLDFNGPQIHQILSDISQYTSNLQLDIFLNAGNILDQQTANICHSQYISILQGLIPLKAQCIICSTSFPDDISSIGNGCFAEYLRYDYQIFSQLKQEPILSPIRSNIHYSDYGVTKFTESEINFRFLRNGVLPKIRYTASDRYIVWKGSRNPQINYHQLSRQVINSMYYYGAHFSFGDQNIDRVAQGNAGVGNNTNWVTYACNHHLAVVLQQISTVP